MATVTTTDRPPRYLRLNHLQSGICQHRARFKVVVCGRRFGKTWTGRTWLTEKAHERHRLWYVAPTYKIAHDIIWRELLDMFPPDWFAKKPNQTRLEMELKTGALLQLKGADDPDSLRGRGVKRVVVDEYADMPDVWDEILRPALADTLGEAMFLGTPKGYNHFHGLYKRGGDIGFPEWQSWRYATWEAPHFQTPQGLIELASLRAETPPHVWRQEYGAEFEARAGMIIGPQWEPNHTVLPTELALLARGRKVGQRIPWHVWDNPRWVPPPGALIYGSVDYGFGAPFAFYLTAEMPDQHKVTFAELYQTRLQDREQAKAIKELVLRLEADHGVSRPSWLVLEPIMFASRKESGQKAIAAIYQEELGPIGIRLIQGAAGRPARLSRPNRWMEALSVAPDGYPYWSVTTACPHLIRTAPEVPWDEDDPDVEDDSSENHGYEAMGRYFEARPVKPKIYAPDALAHLDPVSKAEWQMVEDTWKKPKTGFSSQFQIP